MFDQSIFLSVFDGITILISITALAISIVAYYKYKKHTTTSHPSHTPTSSQPTPAHTPTTPGPGPPGPVGKFQQCTIDVTNPGIDKADHYNNFPDPFQCYTESPCGDGVTLPGPGRQKHCNWKVGKNFVWNKNKEQCILNGGGYPIDQSPLCANGLYSKETPKGDKYNKLFKAWQKMVPKITVKLNGKDIEAYVAIGHGVLDGLCGNTFLIRNKDKDGTYKYVVLLQVDVRAWSLEMTTDAAQHLASDNSGGTCYIPDVMKIDAWSVINNKVIKPI